MSKGEVFFYLILILLIICVGVIASVVASKDSYTVQCAVVTPNGPVPTVSLKGKNVVVTDFGIIKMKEGIYIPTTNEICVIEKEIE